MVKKLKTGQNKICRCVSCQKVGDKHLGHSKGTCLFVCWECEESKVDIKCSKCQEIDPEAYFESIEHRLLYQAGHIFYVCAKCEMKKTKI